MTLRQRCPWDRRQTHLSLAPHLLEEAYEALDAIETLSSAVPEESHRAVEHLQEELGDVLFQVLFHSELAYEEGLFSLADVAKGIHDKLVARHPHVFGSAIAETPEDVAARWEVLKAAEKRSRGITDTVPWAMPSLALAAKVLRKAESLGVPLPSSSEREEEARTSLDAMGSAAASGGTGDEAREVRSAVGRALLAVCDLARRAGVDPETALRAQLVQLRSAIERASASEAPT